MDQLELRLAALRMLRHEREQRQQVVEVRGDPAAHVDPAGAPDVPAGAAATSASRRTSRRLLRRLPRSGGGFFLARAGHGAEAAAVPRTCATRCAPPPSPPIRERSPPQPSLLHNPAPPSACGVRPPRAHPAARLLSPSTVSPSGPVLRRIRTVTGPSHEACCRRGERRVVQPAADAAAAARRCRSTPRLPRAATERPRLGEHGLVEQLERIRPRGPVRPSARWRTCCADDVLRRRRRARLHPTYPQRTTSTSQ